jgi:vacuolar-type H+-ATPase subunit H
MWQGNESPADVLDMIRDKEAEVTRQLVAAREATAKEVSEARLQIQERLSQAEEQGLREGQAERQCILDEADAEAQQMIAQAEAEAATIRQQAPAKMEAAVKLALDIVVGPHIVAQRGSIKEKQEK